MTPRRSSRARGPQPLPTAPTQPNSSNSSVSSGRQERSTRSSQKQSTPRRSNPRSQSNDENNEPKPPTRRTRSGHEDIKVHLKHEKETENNDNGVAVAEAADEEEDEEEEVTRCVCGQAEYPGLPIPVQEQLKLQAKQTDPEYELQAINDEIGGLFVQCDICKVWQHGGCVGILNDTADDYFCEQCRKDLHKTLTAPNGIRYSTYLPTKEEPSSTQTPEPISREKSRRSVDSKNRQDYDPPKRRSTMISREIYDEAEGLRRAIEESKRDALPGDTGRRKRPREEVEEPKTIIKRQRTGSKSISPAMERAATLSSDEALAIKASIEHTPKKNIRGAAARNHAAKELREQKERERMKAADSRQSRIERRRGDESDNAEEPQPTPKSALSTPPAPEVSISRSSNKKNNNGKGTSKSTKRTGRNQYTKDRDIPPSGLSNSLDPNAGDPRNTRARSRSKSAVRDIESPNNGTTSSTNGLSTETPINRFSKIKSLKPARTTMNELKKRIAAIMEYVNRAEDEINRQNSNNTSTHNSTSSVDSVSTAVLDDDQPPITTTAIATVVNGGEMEFGALSSGEMARVLKARLVAWEDEYGRYPR